MKRRRIVKKKRKVSKLVVLSLAIVIVIVLSVVSYYMSQLHGGLEKKPADEYFGIFAPTVDYGVPVEGSNGTKWKILAWSFTLKAVGGAAHTVIIYSEGMAEPYELFDMTENGSRYVPIEFPDPGYLIEMNEDGTFHIPIRIVCKEAEGNITIYLPP